MNRSRIGWTVAVAASVLVMTSACSSKREPSPTVAPASSAERPSTSLPSTTAATSPTPATPPASTGTCGPASPPGSVRASQTAADVDGDGAADTVTVYGTGPDAAPGPYHVNVQLGGGKGTLDMPVVDGGTVGGQGVKLLGAADITASAGAPPDGSGAEIFVTIGSGAAASIVGVYQVTGCSLVRLTGPGISTPSQFPIGGTVTALGGLRCDGTAGGQRLVVMSAQSNDGETYQTTEQRLQVVNGAFVASEPPVTGTISRSDPRFQAFTRLDCPGVESP